MPPALRGALLRREDSTLSERELGAIFTVGAWSTQGLRFVTGLARDAWGTRRTAKAALLSCAGGSAGIAWNDPNDAVALALSLLFIGTGSGVQLCLQPVAAGLFPKHSGSVLASLSGAAQLSGLVFLILTKMGVRRATFTGFACLLMGLAVVAWWPLFSRMAACRVPPSMLDTQYRMHPCISMFPSDLLRWSLEDGSFRPGTATLGWVSLATQRFPCAFIPVQGTEMDDGVSKYNEAEAEAACSAVTMLLQGGHCSVSDIAVVTPYAAQAKLIRRMTQRMTGSTGPPYVQVSSVDGFQGREKESVVFSAVRSNDYGAIGFTKDWRRINVSFACARRTLIVIGNDFTLARGIPIPGDHGWLG